MSPACGPGMDPYVGSAARFPSTGGPWRGFCLLAESTSWRVLFRFCGLWYVRSNAGGLRPGSNGHDDVIGVNVPRYRVVLRGRGWARGTVAWMIGALAPLGHCAR